MSHDFDVVIEHDSEGYYVASVPALPGCHTQARSLDELSDRIKEAIGLYLEVEAETHAVLASILRTCRRQGKDILAVLGELLRHGPAHVIPFRHSHPQLPAEAR